MSEWGLVFGREEDALAEIVVRVGRSVICDQCR